jgi:hypothetical protein
MNERHTKVWDALYKTLVRTRVALGLITVETLAAQNFARWPVENIETVEVLAKHRI